MTTSVGFCLSYNDFKYDFIANKLKRKHRAVTDDVKMLQVSNHVLLHMWSYGFYYMTLSTNYQMIICDIFLTIAQNITFEQTRISS